MPCKNYRAQLYSYFVSIICEVAQQLVLDSFFLQGLSSYSLSLCIFVFSFLHITLIIPFIPSCICSLSFVLYLFSSYMLFLTSIEPHISASLSIHIPDSFHFVSSLILSLCIFLFHSILSLILLFFFLFTFTLYLARTPHLYVLHTSCRRSWREVWGREFE